MSKGDWEDNVLKDGKRGWLVVLEKPTETGFRRLYLHSKKRRGAKKLVSSYKRRGWNNV